jgi:hypothetical protein
LVVALHHAEIEIFGFACLAKDCFVDAATYSSMGFLLNLAYL